MVTREPHGRFFAGNREGPQIKMPYISPKGAICLVEMRLEVGWWRWTESLEMSISATFCSFHGENGNTTLSGRID